MDEVEFCEKATQLIGSDAIELMAFSNGFKAMVAGYFRQQRKLGADAVLQHANRVRLDMRIEIHYPRGLPVVVDQHTAIDHMIVRELVGTVTHRDAMRVADRRFTDPRLLATIDRGLSNASKAGIPLYVGALDRFEDAHAEFLSWDTREKLETKDRPVGRRCQLVHLYWNWLPWECWRAIDQLMEEAGRATGYGVLPLWPVPGVYFLDPACRPYEGPDRLRPKRLSPEERLDEERRLKAHYLDGGEWEPPLGDEPGTIEENDAGIRWVKPASYRELHEHERAKPIRRRRDRDGEGEEGAP